MAIYRKLGGRWVPIEAYLAASKKSGDAPEVSLHWSKKDLLAYADKLGITIPRGTTKAQIFDLIQGAETHD